MNIRVFLKPAGEKWVDVTLSPSANMLNLVSALQTEGFIVAENAFIPRESIYLVLTVVLPATNPPLRMFPGGAGNGRPDNVA